MRPWSEAPADALARVRALVTDLDGTLTDADGKLAPGTYEALAAARGAGLRVIVATGRPAGWCDQIARTWPVDGAVAEGGGVAFSLDAKGRLRRDYLRPARQRAIDQRALERVARAVVKRFPRARVAADQRYRETDFAVDHSEDVRPPLSAAERDAIVTAFAKAGFHATASSVHVNAHAGRYGKHQLSLRLLKAHGLDADDALYVGDAPNDAPAFAAFPLSVGVANVAARLDEVRPPPAFVTRAAFGEGFVEVARRLLAARATLEIAR